MKRMHTEKEIKAIVQAVLDTDLDVGADVINMSGVLYVSEIFAGAITQEEPNLGIDFEFSAVSGIEITNAYCKLEVINSVLYAIANVKIKNVSGAAKKVGAGWGDPAYTAFTVPNSLGDKLIDILGKKVSEGATDGTIITSVPVIALKGTTEDAGTSSLIYPDWRMSLTNRATAGAMGCYIRPNVSTELAAGAEVTLYGRVALTLI